MMEKYDDRSKLLEILNKGIDSDVEIEPGIGEESRSILIFSLSGQGYGLNVPVVEEILGTMEINKIPSTPPHVLGVINLKGKIVPILDLKRLFHIEEAAYGETARILVTKTSFGIVGIMADSVQKIDRIPLRLMEQALPVTEYMKPEFLDGEVHWDGRTLIVLNLENILHGSRMELEVK